MRIGIEENLEGKLDTQQRELLNWKRLIITTLLVVVASAVTSSLTWFILDRTFNESQQMNAALVATLEKKITYLDTRLGGTATTNTGTDSVAAEPLTLQKILNTSYQVGGNTYAVINGTVKVGDNTLLIKSDKTVVNSDGAFVILNINNGTGFIYYLVYMTNVSGNPVQSDAVNLGDRPVVNSTTVSDGKVVLDMIVAGPNDPSCCPSVKTIKTYNITAGKLVEVK